MKRHQRKHLISSVRCQHGRALLCSRHQLISLPGGIRALCRWGRGTIEGVVTPSAALSQRGCAWATQTSTPLQRHSGDAGYTMQLWAKSTQYCREEFLQKWQDFNWNSEVLMIDDSGFSVESDGHTLTSKHQAPCQSIKNCSSECLTVHSLLISGKF